MAYQPVNSAFLSPQISTSRAYQPRNQPTNKLTYALATNFGQKKIYFRLNAASKFIRRHSDSANLQSCAFRTWSPSAIARGHYVSYFHICAMLLFISQKLLPQLPPLPTHHCLLLLKGSILLWSQICSRKKNIWVLFLSSCCWWLLHSIATQLRTSAVQQDILYWSRIGEHILLSGW